VVLWAWQSDGGALATLNKNQFLQANYSEQPGSNAIKKIIGLLRLQGF
jgi:hypothetical protein